jgi:hypothetical protein
MRKYTNLALAALITLAAFGGLAAASNSFRADLPAVRMQEDSRPAPFLRGHENDPAVAATLLPRNRG